MNPTDLVSAFVLAGLDTPAKVQAVLTDLASQLELKRLDIEEQSLMAKQVELIKPVTDRRVEIANQRAALAATLAPKG